MIEFGKVANIRPRNKKLFIPTDRDPRGFIFADKARVDFKKTENFGQFQQAWLHAQALTIPDAIRDVERIITSSARVTDVRIGKHSRGKSMNVSFMQAREQTKREMRTYVNAQMRRNYMRDDG